MAEDTLQKTTFLFEMKEDLGNVPADVADALRSIGAVANEVNGLLGKLAGPAGLLAGGAGAFEIVSKSLEVARQADESLARLKSAAGGTDALVKQVQQLAKALSATSVFGQQNIIQVAADLLNRGVGQNQLPAALKSAVDLASALRLSLDDAGKEIAATFGGTVPRDLSRALPQLKEMMAQSLELGGALDIIDEKFGGQAEALADTPFGKAAQETNAVTDQYKEIGDQLVRLELQVLPVAIELLKSFNEALKTPAGQAFLSLLGHALENMLRIGPTLAAIGLAGKALGGVVTLFDALGASADNAANSTTRAGRAAEEAAQASQRASAEGRLFGIGAAAAAGGYLGYTSSGLGGILRGAEIASAAASSGPAGMIAAAAAAADALYILASRLLGVNTDFDGFDKQIKLATDTLNNLASGKTSARALGDAVLGTVADFARDHLGVDVATEGDDRGQAQIASDNASAASGDQLIAARSAKYKQQFEELQKEFSDLEIETGKQTSDEVEKQDAESNKRKYAARLETLQQYLAEERKQQLAAIQKQMADDQEQIHKLDEQGLRDRAAGLNENAMQEMQKRNALQKEYNELLLQSKEIQQAQAEEALELSARQAALADESLQKSVGRTRDLVSQGVVSPEQGRTDVMGSLADYQARIQDVRTVLESLATVPGEIGVEARQAIAALDAEARDVADKTVKAVSDVRTVGQASKDAADSIQKSFQGGLSKFLDDIIERTTTAKKAWQDFMKTLLDSTINQTTGRISEQIAGLLSGGASGGGIFGTAGAATQGNVSGTQKSAGGLISSLLGGVRTVLGADNNSGSGNQPASTDGGTQPPAQSSGSSGSGGGGLVGGLVGLLGALLKLFDSGGYTGNADPSAVAGLVHGGEYVVPAGAVKSMGGPDALGQFLSSAMPSASIRLPSTSSGQAGQAGGALDRLHAAAGSLENAADSIRSGGGTAVLPAVAVNEDLVGQIAGHPSSARNFADLMVRNPGAFAPAVKALSKQ